MTVGASAPRCLALITARGGSKGVPRKNVRPVGGRPLIAWTVEAARASRFVTRTILSSDDPEIIAAAEAAGCEAPFVRPPELATDEATSKDVVRHAMDWAERDGGRWDYLVLLQPTSPLRTSADIDACIALCLDRAAPTAVSVTESAKSPHWMFGRAEDGALSRLFPPPQNASRRQALPVAYLPNGAVYAARWEHLATGGWFLDPGALGYVMPAERSIDIDTELDMKIADILLREHFNPI